MTSFVAPLAHVCKSQEDGSGEEIPVQSNLADKDNQGLTNSFPPPEASVRILEVEMETIIKEK